MTSRSTGHETRFRMGHSANAASRDTAWGCATAARFADAEPASRPWTGATPLFRCPVRASGRVGTGHADASLPRGSLPVQQSLPGRPLDTRHGRGPSLKASAAANAIGARADRAWPTTRLARRSRRRASAALAGPVCLTSADTASTDAAAALSRAQWPHSPCDGGRHGGRAVHVRVQAMA